MNEQEELQEQVEGAEAVEQDDGQDGASGQDFVDLVKELEEVRQHVLYAQAETQNVRRRLEQEKQTAATYAAAGFARDMLSVKDNLDRALSAVPEELRQDEKLKALLTGIEATTRELELRLPAPRHQPRRSRRQAA